MKAAAIVLLSGALALASGCAHEYMYVPVGPGAAGGPAARYPIPPAAPQGEAYVTSFGFTDMDVGPGRPGTMMHARLAVSNGSAGAWTVDGRQQVLAAPGAPPQSPAFLNTDAGTGPVYVVPPGEVRVFDLYYALPPPLDQAQSLQGFELDWNVDAGGQPVGDRTPFQRYEGYPASYAAYPPYVTVGLGFGLGWWYAPFFPYRYRYPPVIRGYYYPPVRARGGAWRGAPPGRWRGTPPGTWRGTPSGTWRGTPAPVAAPRATPRAAPAPRGGGGWRGGGRRH